MIESRKTERRMVTSDPRQMLNKYLAKNVYKTWKEEFTDTKTGEKVEIERSELLHSAGELITQDKLATIRFDMQAGDISEVEVSNQRRMAYLTTPSVQMPFVAGITIDSKTYKILLHAKDVDNALTILKDYVELNYEGAIYIRSLKLFDKFVILTDNLEQLEQTDVDMQYLKGEIDAEKYTEDSVAAGSARPLQKRYYQTEISILYSRGSETECTFVVHTFSLERSLMLVKKYLDDREEHYAQLAEKHGDVYERQTFTLSVKTFKPIAVSAYIPREFSEVYIAD